MPEHEGRTLPGSDHDIHLNEEGRSLVIHAALGTIATELNTYLARKEPARYRGEKPAIVSDLVDQDGKLVVRNDSDKSDNVIVTLVNVEEETAGKAQLPYERRPDQSIDIVQPEIRVNLFVLFTAFSNMKQDERYLNCLRLVAYVVQFFQHKPVFDHRNTPDLHEDVQKLIADLVSLTFEQQNHLWGALGAKLMPSVLYRLRLLVLQDDEDALGGRLVRQVQLESGVVP